MRAGDFVGAKIYRKPTEDKRTKKDGTPRSPKKLGKIHFPVFTPGGTRVVGFMVRQSDIAGMIERPDRFVALDAIGVYEGAIAVDDVKGTYDATAAKLWDEYQLTVSQAEELCVEFDSLTALRAQVADLRGKIRALGSVNVSAIEEYKEVKARYDELSRQVTDVEESRNELGRMIAKLSAQMREIFTDSFRAINENFSRVFTELFGGGEASLVLEDESDVLACGIGIRVAPPGKVIKNLEALSGGEQALVAISIYFAILAVNPAPFCILDEIEAALDDANVVRFAQYLRRISDKTQFIVITHRRGTMEAANVLYGVTMQEDGVSKLLKLDLEQVDATLVS